MVEGFYKLLTDRVLFALCLFILAGSVYISIKTKFIQIRSIPFLWKVLKSSSRKSSYKEGNHTISPFKALFTAMSTTLGISTLVGPVIAIQLGGPGALIGFILTSF
ncbi:MAG: sodium:alanine symporter family protein, partial [Verrucomicrobia bacterium]|nr:sodium:alanine symporter family protein [Verrucomicrobiota bacterium]